VSDLLEPLAAGLARDVAAATDHLLPTYAHRVWPADNEVAAAALELYGTSVGPDAGIARGLAGLQSSLAALERNGLPPSAVAAARLAGIDVPRGCALSWTVAMRGLYDPARAKALYLPYRSSFFVVLGPIHGFREWPPGIDRPADGDSGPIVGGIGLAASGIGIAAAQLAGEHEHARALMESAELAGITSLEAQRGDHWLERALTAWVRTARPWR
jgi:hypothetical protein